MLRLVGASFAGLAFSGTRLPAPARAQTINPCYPHVPCGGSFDDCYLPGRDLCCPGRQPGNPAAAEVAYNRPNDVCCWANGMAYTIEQGRTCCSGDVASSCAPGRRVLRRHGVLPKAPRMLRPGVLQEGQECIRGECAHVCKNEKGRGVSRVYDPQTQCCTEWGIERKYPIENFTRCEKTCGSVRASSRTRASTTAAPQTDRRSLARSVKLNFLPHCKKHDRCYDTCRSDRKEWDRDFCEGLFKACANAYPKVRGKKGPKRSSCEGLARVYCDAVVALGSIAYDDAQSKACQCCP